MNKDFEELQTENEKIRKDIDKILLSKFSTIDDDYDVSEKAHSFICGMRAN